MPNTAVELNPPLNRRNFLLGSVALGAAAARPNPANAKIQGLVIIGKDDWLFPIWDDVTRTDLKAIDTVSAVYDTAIDLLAKAKIQTVMMISPAKSRIYHDMLPDDLQYSADSTARYDRARTSLAKNGTLVPDLATPLLALHKAQPTLPLYFKGDTHWTGPAAEVAATALAVAIKDKIKLPAAPGPAVAFAPTIGRSKQERNDLAVMLTGPDKAKYKLEEFAVHTVAQNAGGLLEGDTPGDVVLIGNSFTQPRFGFANMLSNQLGRPVTLYWKVHQFGPYFTLLDYLASPIYKARKPALIIWDYHETDCTVPPEHKDVWATSAMPTAEFLGKLRTALGV
jgi:alginate O-acetyltransferase complex protein AlgJ